MLMIFLLISFSFTNAQETKLIVKGSIKSGNQIRLSKTFSQNLFCFEKGDYVLPWLDRFDIFQVDSVISGNFQNSIGEQCKVPFNLTLGRINECTVLDYNATLTLNIKQFPNTNYYYIDSIEKVFPNDLYAEKVELYRKQHEKIIEILKKGTNQEKKNALDGTNDSKYGSNSDYRYIKYIIPYLKSKDSITDYSLLCWDGYDKNGNGIGGTDTIFEKKLFSEYILNYLHKIPFEVPSYSDTINWDKWYSGLFSRQECFPSIKIVHSYQTTIAPCNGIAYFLPDNKNKYIYIKSQLPYCLNIASDDLKMTRIENSKMGELSYIRPFVVSKDNEVAFFDWHDKIIWGREEKGTYYKQGEILIKELKYDNTHKIERTFPNIVIPSFNDFILFWGEDIEENNFARIGKLNRQGEWIISPINIFKYKQPFYLNSSPEVGALSYLPLSDTVFFVAFSVDDYQKEDNSAIFIKKIDSNLKIIDSISFVIDFPSFDYSITENYLVKNNGLYLLLCKTHHNNGSELYFRILNDKLQPETDFILIAKAINQVSVPISVNDGFVISWTDNEIIDNNFRSILINKECKKSEIFNIMQGNIKSIYNYEFDCDNLDYYINIDNMLIRKRLDIKKINFR